ncbi:MAG TPA: DNA repair protein RadC [Thermoanaerobaculia bacterium]|nr:DNA repair protein RadC [Thermoanaerobaculia bacterium]
MPETKSWLIADLPEDDRPRERLLRLGAGALSDQELVALVLRSGVVGTPVLKLAADVLEQHGGLSGLVGTDARDIRMAKLLGLSKAASLLAAVEIGCRMARGQLPARALLTRPAEVARYLVLKYQLRDQEVMGALFLNVRHGLISDKVIYRGTLHRAAVEPREILNDCLRRGAAAFALFHTHPSGDPTPSVEDLAFTGRMALASRLVGVAMLDHLVLGAIGQWVSLQAWGGW